tara:strand:+ start:4201 stop:6204 length:2004 start_codon:yes stop_codon:yes gene_type:complete
MINVAFYLGHQWISYDRHTHSVFTPKAAKGRVRVTANLLQPQALKVVSLLTRQRPEWDVMPTTGDHEDVSSAIAGQLALRHYWRESDMDEKLHDAYLWLTVCGNAFIRVFWDPKGGPRMDVPKEDLADMPQDVKAAAKKLPSRDGVVTVPLGDLGYEVLSPFQLDVDPETMNFQDAKWSIQSKSRSLSWVRDRYPSAEVAAGSGLHELSVFYEDKIRHMAGPQETSSTLNFSKDPATQDALVVHDLWVNPCSDAPRGRHYVVADGKVLNRSRADQDLPYSFLKAPLIHIKERNVPGRLWGTCALEQSLRLQSEYNRLRSQIVEHHNETIRPKVLVPIGSEVNIEALSGPPGSHVWYIPGLAPGYMSIPPLPGDLFRRAEAIKQDIRDTSAIQEVTQGRARANLRSGRAIEALQQQDESNLDPTLSIIERELGRLGSWSLSILAEHLEEPRLIRIVGRSNLLEALELKGSDLLGDEANIEGQNQFDVVVRLGSQIPHTRGGKLALIGDLTGMGYLNPQAHADKVLGMFGMGPDDSLFDFPKLQRGLQLREMQTLVIGGSVEVEDWHDHAVHLEVIRRMQLQPDYELRPQGARDAIEEHAALHVQFIQQEMVAAEAAAGEGEDVPPPEVGMPVENITVEPNTEQIAAALGLSDDQLLDILTNAAQGGRI